MILLIFQLKFLSVCVLKEPLPKSLWSSTSTTVWQLGVGVLLYELWETHKDFPPQVTWFRMKLKELNVTHSKTTLLSHTSWGWLLMVCIVSNGWLHICSVLCPLCSQTGFVGDVFNCQPSACDPETDVAAPLVQINVVQHHASPPVHTDSSLARYHLMSK